MIYVFKSALKWCIGVLVLVTGAQAQLTVSEVATLPVRVSNNAVCEGFINQKPYLFSFGGIDSTKKYTGIHKKCFRVDLTEGTSIRIPDLPDDRGKIASAASRVGDTLYITGGYYVFQNQTERSSDKVHRYDINKNQFLPDGKPIPVATDDHVQAVWRDSLIYLITGWKDSKNIPNVQVYNPALNDWSQGTAVPNNPSFTSFGASGTIVGDTIFYFGGAASTSGFPIQNELRKGVIDPTNPMKIEWTEVDIEVERVGYRMAATHVNGVPHWIGGSTETYNYDGIAYRNGRGVQPAARDLSFDFGKILSEKHHHLLPMDLRGIAFIKEHEKYLAGGMETDQKISNKVIRLSWFPANTSEVLNGTKTSVYPNPCIDGFAFQSEFNITSIQLFNSRGQLVKTYTQVDEETRYSIEELCPGLYFLRLSSEGHSIGGQLIKQ